MEIIKMIILGLSSLLLIFVGTMRLSNPIKTYLDSSGIELPNNVNLLNEVKGVSALMLCAGIIVALGIFVPQLTFSSFLVGALVFLGFAMGRFASIMSDGTPNKKITQGIAFELVLGLGCLYGLIMMWG